MLLPQPHIGSEITGIGKEREITGSGSYDMGYRTTVRQPAFFYEIESPVLLHHCLQYGQHGKHAYKKIRTRICL